MVAPVCIFTRLGPRHSGRALADGMIVTLCRYLVGLAICVVGLLSVLWGVFCFFGGPDPGAGSGHEGPKWGAGSTGVGAALVTIGVSLLMRKRPGKHGQTAAPNGGPAPPLGNSEVGGGPPSMS